MADEKEEVKKDTEQSEEEQIAAMVKAKSSKTPGEPVSEKKPAPADEKAEETDDEKAKPEKKEEKSDEEKELSEKEITAKIKELEGKDEKDLTDEDKKFLEENKEEEPEALSPDKFIEEEFGKDYDIKNMKDLAGFMETAVEVIKERDDLKVKLEAAEKKEPAYRSESQKKVALFLEKTGYDPEKFPEGLMTYAQLMAMDLEDTKSLNPKLVLEAEYVLDHPELTRDEARRKHEKIYAKKYMLNKEDFEKPEELAEAEEDLRIEQKTAVAKAVKGLKKAQDEFKAQPSKDDKKDDPKLVEVDPVIQKSIEQSNSDLDKHLKENDQLIFSPTENEDDDFPYQFKEDQIKAIRVVSDSILKNPSSYDKKGKLLLGSGVDDLVKRVADFLYGDDIRDKLYEHAQTVTAAKRIEEISEKSPNRKPKGGAAADIDLSEEKQIEILTEKKKGKAVMA